MTAMRSMSLAWQPAYAPIGSVALLVLASACAPGAPPEVSSTHHSVASVTAIINCGYPESVAARGLTWSTRYVPDDPAGPLWFPRARVEVTNRSAIPHTLHLGRGIE